MATPHLDNRLPTFFLLQDASTVVALSDEIATCAVLPPRGPESQPHTNTTNVAYALAIQRHFTIILILPGQRLTTNVAFHSRLQRFRSLPGDLHAEEVGKVLDTYALPRLN